ncbi:BRCA1-associated protein [Vitis vinifera]|uniref:BRCA1-associated protein n=1 Tax=Vitis vinifera TaxID=29760 RepID=A0A438C0L0_VITVI|nr:BRCA1-associated protein [Vitis vinifera]
MFALRVHSVDDNHPLSISSNPNPNLGERRGMVHLFRSLSLATALPRTTSRTTLLFVVAVPNYLSSDDFIRFCGSHIDEVSELLVIRNDAVEDRYSVVIKFMNQLYADAFYCIFNGKRFSPGEVDEAEVCHLLFMLSAEYTESADFACTPPPGFTELPTCPVCLGWQNSARVLWQHEVFQTATPNDLLMLDVTLTDVGKTSNNISSGPTYTSHPQTGSFIPAYGEVCQFCQQQDEKPTCFVCGTSENLWVCMICGFAGCGRYKEGHAIRHWKDAQHSYSLDLEKQQVWDYVGDSFVHRLNQSKADGKLAMMDSRCMSTEGDCGTYGCTDDSGISAALFSSKVEAIVDEYNHLLATEMETQRQYYESLLLEAKAKRESSVLEAVEKAVTSKMQDIQNELEKCLEEKKAVSDINQKLIKNQDLCRKKVKEIEERAIQVCYNLELVWQRGDEMNAMFYAHAKSYACHGFWNLA